MLSSRLLRASALVAVAFSTCSLPAAAQQNQQWFVPNQPRTAPARPAPRPAPAPSAQPEAQTLAPGLTTEAAPPGTEGQPQQQVQMQLPPPPEVPPLPIDKVPPLIVVNPEYELFPVNVSVPLPSLFTTPLPPEITPA